MQASHGFGPQDQLRYVREHAEELGRDWRRANGYVQAAGGYRRSPTAHGLVAIVRRSLGLAVIRLGEVIWYDGVTRDSYDAADDFVEPDARGRAA